MKTTKKAISIVLAGLMTAGSMSALSVFAVEETLFTIFSCLKKSQLIVGIFVSI